MQSGVLRVLRATAASWWRHRELRRTGQTALAQRLERQTVLRDLGQGSCISSAASTAGSAGRRRDGASASGGSDGLDCLA